MTEVKQGQILRLTRGCYSDWSIIDELLVLKDFNVHEEAKKYGKILEDCWDDDFSYWLIGRGLVSTDLPQEVVEVHQGNYDTREFYGIQEGEE